MADPLQNYDALRVRAEHLGWFETALLHGRLSDPGPISDTLAESIRARMAVDAGIDRSNVGGWHSRTDMLAWGGPAAAKLVDMAIKAAKRLSHFEDRDAATVKWSARMWANVMPSGGLSMSHAHPGVLWAAVYYVDMGFAAGEPRQGGELFFEDPRFPVQLMTFPGFRAIGPDGQPQPVDRIVPTERGDLVVFPGYLRHGVRPHKGSRDRISIALNLYASER